MSDLININHFNFDNNNLYTNFISNSRDFYTENNQQTTTTFTETEIEYIDNVKTVLNNTFNGDNILNIRYADFETPLFNDTTVWSYFQFNNIDNRLFDKTISYWNRQNDPIIGQAYNNLNDQSLTRYNNIYMGNYDYVGIFTYDDYNDNLDNNNIDDILNTLSDLIPKDDYFNNIKFKINMMDINTEKPIKFTVFFDKSNPVTYNMQDDEFRDVDGNLYPIYKNINALKLQNQQENLLEGNDIKTQIINLSSNNFDNRFARAYSQDTESVNRFNEHYVSIVTSPNDSNYRSNDNIISYNVELPANRLNKLSIEIKDKILINNTYYFIASWDNNSKTRSHYRDSLFFFISSNDSSNILQYYFPSMVLIKADDFVLNNNSSTVPFMNNNYSINDFIYTFIGKNGYFELYNSWNKRFYQYHIRLYISIFKYTILKEIFHEENYSPNGYYRMNVKNIIPNFTLYGGNINDDEDDFIEESDRENQQSWDSENEWYIQNEANQIDEDDETNEDNEIITNNTRHFMPIPELSSPKSVDIGFRIKFKNNNLDFKLASPFYYSELKDLLKIFHAFIIKFGFFNEITREQIQNEINIKRSFSSIINFLGNVSPGTTGINRTDMICKSLDRNYGLNKLREVANNLPIQNVNTLNKRQLCAEIAKLTDRVNKLIKIYKPQNKILRKFGFHNAQRYCDVNSNIDIIELINIAKNANINYNSLANNNNSSFKRLLCAELAKYYDSFTTSDGICNNYDEWDLYDSEIYSQSNPGNFFIINPPNGESKCISRSYFDPAVNPTLNNVLYNWIPNFYSQNDFLTMSDEEKQRRNIRSAFDFIDASGYGGMAGNIKHYDFPVLDMASGSSQLIDENSFNLMNYYYNLPNPDNLTYIFFFGDGVLTRIGSGPPGSANFGVSRAHGQNPRPVFSIINVETKRFDPPTDLDQLQQGGKPITMDDILN